MSRNKKTIKSNKNKNDKKKRTRRPDQENRYFVDEATVHANCGDDNILHCQEAMPILPPTRNNIISQTHTHTEKIDSKSRFFILRIGKI